MHITVGENLKRFRKSKGITQEELAEFLGISFQSVSKWERGESYPDITMLPGISTFFGVSVDELMGMREIRSDTKLNDIFRQETIYQREGKYQDAAILLRNALKYFPNNCSLMSELALALSHEDVNAANGMESIKEAITLCKRVQDNCENEKVRSTSISHLCYLYNIVNETENAVAVASTLPHIWESREMIWPDMLDGQERIEKLKKSILTALSVIYDKIKSVNLNEKYIPKMIASGPVEYEKDEMINGILKFIG